MAVTSYDAVTTDFNSGMWMKDWCLNPFLESLFKRFAEQQDGAPWTAVDVGCGMGRHTLGLLKAGASSVLAFDVSKNMLEGAKEEVDKFLHSNNLITPGKVEFAEASATHWSSIPEAQEGGFDLAICIYVLCTLLSKEEVRKPSHRLHFCHPKNYYILHLCKHHEELFKLPMQVKQALAEIFKMLKPGGKLMFFEAHVIQYMEWDDKATIPLRHVWATPKQDGTRFGYFEDEGKPREVILKMNSGREIKLIDRLYTLSSWVSFIVEAGFQITQLHEPYVDPKLIPTDAPDYMKFAAGKPAGMCWECTKP